MATGFVDGSNFKLDGDLDSRRVDAGIFDPKNRDEFDKESLNVLDAFEIVSSSSKNRGMYDVWTECGHQIIKTPHGVQTVKGYVYSLETAVLGLNLAVSEANKKYNTVSIFKYLKYRFRLYLKAKRYPRELKALGKALGVN